MDFLVCVECRVNRIPAPVGSSEATRFTCRDCSQRLNIAANVEAARRLRPYLTFVFGPERFSEDTGADGRSIAGRLRQERCWPHRIFSPLCILPLKRWYKMKPMKTKSLKPAMKKSSLAKEAENIFPPIQTPSAPFAYDPASQLAPVIVQTFTTYSVCEDPVPNTFKRP